MSPQKCLLEKNTSLHVHQSQCQTLISLLLKSGLSCVPHLNEWHWHLSQRIHWQIKGPSLLSSSLFFFFFPFGCSVWLVGGILVSWPGFEPEGHVLTSLSSLFSTTTLLQSWLRPHRSPICIGCYFIFLSPLSSLSSPASTLLPWLPSPPVSLTRYSPQCFLSYCLQHDIRLSRKVPHEFYVLGATQPFHICSLRFFPEELSKVGFIILLLQMRKQTWSIESLHPHGVSSRALFWTNSRSVLYTSLPSPPNWGEQGPS